jgi:hypothetical protein
MLLLEAPIMMKNGLLGSAYEKKKEIKPLPRILNHKFLIFY